MSMLLGSTVRLAVGVLTVLTFTSMLYGVLVAVAAFAARRYRRSPGPRRPASVLVPLCGDHPSLRGNLEALRAALAPGDELLLGAARPDDPALAVARGILAGEGRARIVAGTTSRATNPKVATLAALEPLVTRGTVVLVDADVRLSAALLDGLLAPLAEAGTGLVTALYRGVPSGSLASRLEALTINVDFVPSVLVAHLLGGGIDFALGAANAARRDVLEAIGGIVGLGEVLADDHVLGKRVSQAGYRVTIAPVCVPICLDSSPRDTLARLVRWCRTYRVCQPAGYAATLVLHHGVACATAALGLAALGGGSIHAAAMRLTALLLLRTITGLLAHLLIAGRDADVRSLPLLGVRDLVGSVLFLAAWSGRRVTWGGTQFYVARDGTLRRRQPGWDVTVQRREVRE
jgi:ceramide glucosyltransferase